MDGVRGDGLLCSPCVLNLSETHADDLLLGFLSMAGGIFGVPPHLLMKNAGCPSMSLLLRFGPRGWNDCDGCHRFFRDARLSGALVWAGDGHSSHAIAVYCIYGPAGARWDQSIMAYLDSLLEAVALDAAARGLPSSVATLTLSLMSPLCFPACCLVAGGMLLSGLLLHTPAVPPPLRRRLALSTPLRLVFCAGVLLAPGRLPAA